MTSKKETYVSPMVLLSCFCFLPIITCKSICSSDCDLNSFECALKSKNSWSFKKRSKQFCWSTFLLSDTPINGHATKSLIKKEAWKLNFFCLENASIGWQTEQSDGATQTSRIDEGLGAKPASCR